MHIAILTFDGFNELDSLISLGSPESHQETRVACFAVLPAADGDVDERRCRSSTMPIVRCSVC